MHASQTYTVAVGSRDPVLANNVVFYSGKLFKMSYLLAGQCMYIIISKSLIILLRCTKMYKTSVMFSD